MSAADAHAAAARSATGTGVRRVLAGTVAVLVAGVDLSAKAWATSFLRDRVVELGPLDLRLAYNPGVAFSIGAAAPGWLVVTATGAVTAAVAVFTWRTAARSASAQVVALALVLGGAVANLVDRARVVWSPTTCTPGGGRPSTSRTPPSSAVRSCSSSVGSGTNLATRPPRRLLTCAATHTPATTQRTG